MIINSISSVNDFTYQCNGVNDDMAITIFIKKIRSKGHSNFTIEIEGTFKKESASAIAIDNFNYTPITLDFSKCNRIISNGAFLDVTNVTVKNCAVYHQSNLNDVDIATFSGNNAIYENCKITGSYKSGTCYGFKLTDSRIVNCDATISNNSGALWGIYGNNLLINGCRINVSSSTASCYGIEAIGSFTSNSTFRGETLSKIVTTSGNGGIGGGYYNNCRFIGIGALKGQGFFMRSGAFLDMNNCVCRGYTKDATNGWGIGLTGQVSNSNTLSLIGMNCNSEELTGFYQTKSMEMLDGYGTYSGTFFSAVNMADTITSLGSYIRDRN